MKRTSRCRGGAERLTAQGRGQLNNPQQLCTVCSCVRETQGIDQLNSPVRLKSCAAMQHYSCAEETQGRGQLWVTLCNSTAVQP